MTAFTTPVQTRTLPSCWGHRGAVSLELAPLSMMTRDSESADASILLIQQSAELPENTIASFKQGECAPQCNVCNAPAYYFIYIIFFSRRSLSTYSVLPPLKGVLPGLCCCRFKMELKALRAVRRPSFWFPF